LLSIAAVHCLERRQMPAGIVQVRVEAILQFQQDTRAGAAAIGAIARLACCARARLPPPGIGLRHCAAGGNGLWPI